MEPLIQKKEPAVQFGGREMLSGWSLRRWLCCFGVLVSLFAAIALLTGACPSFGGDRVATIDPDNGLPLYLSDPLLDDFDLPEIDPSVGTDRAFGVTGVKESAPLFIEAGEIAALLENPEPNARMLRWEGEREEALLAHRVPVESGRRDFLTQRLPFSGTLSAGISGGAMATGAGAAPLLESREESGRPQRTPVRPVSSGRIVIWRSVGNYHSIRNGYAGGYAKFAQLITALRPFSPSPVIIHSSSIDKTLHASGFREDGPGAAGWLSNRKSDESTNRERTS